MFRREATTLLATTAAVIATSTVGGLATRPAIQSIWYVQLRKPSYQPPRLVFPIVWPALYADIAIVSATSVDALRGIGEDRKRRGYVVALLLNLLLNGSWSWVFFDRHHLGASTALNVALTASSADLTRRAIDARGKRGAALAVYPLWCAFATLLSGHIWMLNRRRAQLSRNRDRTSGDGTGHASYLPKTR
ncbi:TspO protein [Mycobacterium kyorinense]|uniref:TspO protein n=1 Tax=Mycobacterium kyorinense TaxID=487514 RepID=A0A1A2ZFJ8_9MYCO|nr:TspO/MBR family protein [Mycobacterium kyorinense]OBI48277.1 TspO protein [Mycobacterium kyorinense]